MLARTPPSSSQPAPSPTARSLLAVLGSALLDLAVPGECAGCGAAGPPVCPACSAALGAPARRTSPDPEPDGLPPVWCVAGYDGPVRALLLAHKEHGRLGLARPLGAALTRPVSAALAAAGLDAPERVLIVPVPSSRASVRSRGHDALLRTARRCARALRGEGVDVLAAPVLRQSRRVGDQAALAAPARKANLYGALAVRRGARRAVAGAVVVVVDDVVTTGSTLVADAAALRDADAVVVGAATVAATRRRHSRRRSATGPLPAVASTD